MTSTRPRPGTTHVTELSERIQQRMALEAAKHAALDDAAARILATLDLVIPRLDRITRQLTALAELLDDPEPAGPRAVGSVTVLAGHARLVKAIRGVLRVGIAEKELPCGRFTEKIRQSGGGIPTHPLNLSSG